MEPVAFHGSIAGLAQRLTRRRSLGVLSGLAAGALTTGASASKHKKKKHPFCLNGQTVNAAGKKKQKLIKHGATPGACIAACACATDQICDAGICQTCAVTCTDDPVGCGVRLQQRLLDGGTVYVCPGRYVGNFTTDSVRLVGAGSGEDPLTSTILDGGLNQRVLSIDVNASVELAALRITRGKTPVGQYGGGVFAVDGSDLRITSYAIVGNEGEVGAGIAAGGSLRLANSTVSGNDASYFGELYLTATGPSFITDSVITGNRSLVTGASLGGGGLFHSGSPLSITGTEISNNTAGSPGGGIANESGEIMLSASCRITGNVASTGGAIARTGGAVSVNGATVSGNSTPECVGVTC